MDKIIDSGSPVYLIVTMPQSAGEALVYVDTTEQGLMYDPITTAVTNLSSKWMSRQGNYWFLSWCTLYTSTKLFSDILADCKYRVVKINNKFEYTTVC